MIIEPQMLIFVDTSVKTILAITFKRFRKKCSEKIELTSSIAIEMVAEALEVALQAWQGR